jgi:tRNA pseudouridine55 synthase
MPLKVINVYKKKGQTPLDCIKEIKKDNPELVHLPLTYAGRLDPLAEGVLLILIGDECQKKDEYLALSKEYELEILFGFETDTYDLMGRVEVEVQPLTGFGGCTSTDSNDNYFSEIKNLLSQFIGRINQDYPPYSSRTVNGKPLFKWAREGKLNEIIIPSHQVYVSDIEFIKEDYIFGFDLLSKIKNDIGFVKGDFRQKEIINIWEDVLKNGLENKYKTITLRVSCGSGVYVRSLAHDLGKKIGISALALNIKRTKVGEFKNIN